MAAQREADSQSVLEFPGRIPFVAFAAVTLLMFSGAGCMGLSSSDSAQAPSLQGGAIGGGGSTASFANVSGSALQAFQKGLYSFALSNCVQCHGLTQIPLFAASNVNEAYFAIAKPDYVNFQNPSASLIVAYAGNGHCGINNCMGSSQSAAVQNFIQAWEAALVAAPSSAPGAGGTGSGSSAAFVLPSSAISYETAAMNLPVPLPLPTTATSFALLRWNLGETDQLSPANAAVGNSIFEVEVQQFTPTVYRFMNPRFANATGSPITVSGLHLLVNGEEFPLAVDWVTAVNASVNPNMPNPVPSGPMTSVTPLTTDAMDVEVSLAPNVDVIQFGFETLGAPHPVNTSASSMVLTSATILVNGGTQVITHLVDGSGNTLYMFSNDTQDANTSACTLTCSTTWPPFKVTAGQTPTIQGSVVASDVGTFVRGDGTTQVTYMGWPLYYYYQDLLPANQGGGPGTDNGDQLNNAWFMIEPNGVTY